MNFWVTLIVAPFLLAAIAAVILGMWFISSVITHAIGDSLHIPADDDGFFLTVTFIVFVALLFVIVAIVYFFPAQTII